MSDWQPIGTAPDDEPVRVWGSLDPSNPLMSWREFTAVKVYRSYWVTHGRSELRLFPTHWMPLPAPQLSRNRRQRDG